MNLNINNLVRQSLPPHKRQPVRLSFLRLLLFPLIWLWNIFVLWRKKIRLETDIIAQVRALEGYLQDKYNDPTVTIITFKEEGFALGLRSEGMTHSKPVGLNNSEISGNILLRGEDQELFGGVDFIVYISMSVDIEAVRADIERYKPALITYKIIQR